MGKKNRISIAPAEKAVSRGALTKDEAISLKKYQREIFSNHYFTDLLMDKIISINDVIKLTELESEILSCDVVTRLINLGFIPFKSIKELRNGDDCKLWRAYSLIVSEIFSVEEVLKLDIDFCTCYFNEEVNDLIIKKFLSIDQLFKIEDESDIKKIRLCYRLISKNKLTVDEVVQLGEETIEKILELKNLIDKGALSFSEIPPFKKDLVYLSEQFKKKIFSAMKY